MLLKLTALRSWWTACLLLFATIAFAQQRTISGKVTDANNAPVAGATVAVKGANVATQTNAQGDFSLSVPGNNSVLVISYVGFEQREVAVGSQSAVAINLTASSSNLNEVVVTGYTSQQRRNIVGAVATVSGAKLSAVQSGNAEQQFQGRVPGLTVITTGQPGTTSQVRIRGFGSFSNNEPLYIVDGIPTTNIDFINGNDIENTTVLKDAGSASIYGARAAAGVIIVTTKKGKANGKLNVQYDLSYGYTVPGKGVDLLSPQQQADLTKEALLAAGQVATHPQYGTGTFVLPDYLKVGGSFGLSGLAANDPRLDPALFNTNFEKGAIYQVIRANKAGTDWYDELTEVNPIQNHTLAISGGNEMAKYYAGFSLYDEKGTVINTYLKRYGLRLNTEFNVKNRVRIGQNFQFTFRENPNIGFFPASENSILFALTINPLIPVYDEGGGFAGTTAQGFNNSNNPIAGRIRSKDNKGYASNIFGNIYAEADLTKDLTFRTSWGGNFFQFQNRFITYRTYENSENTNNNTFGEQGGNGGGWTWTNTLRYVKVFGDHSLTALGGIEAIKDGYFRFLGGTGLNPFSLSPTYLTLTNTDPTGRSLNSGGNPLRKLYSQFAKVDYQYKDKYLLTALVRRDGSSVFGEEDKYGVFPAVSAGWRITEENFLNNVSWMNELKIRGGWGIMGNERPVGSANRFNSIGGGPGATYYDLGGTNTSTLPGIAVVGLGNPNAKWEDNTTVNIGFDGTFFNNKLDVIFDWYTRTTSDLLYNPELPATLGTSAPPVVNIGEMKNTGIDMMITYKGNAGPVRFETDLIFTKYKNSIEKIADGVLNFDRTFSGRIGGGFVRNAVGEPVSSFFGYKVIGLFQTAAEVAAAPTQAGAGIGRFRYEDVNGDKAITSADRDYIGNPNPDFTYGFNAKVFIKSFDLEALFYGVQGGEVLNFTRWFTDFYPSFAGIGKSTRVLDAWTPTNTSATIPRFENVSNASTNGELNSYYVEKGSYFRLRSLKIGYNVSPAMIRRAGLEKLRFFIQGTNLFTATKYTGTDPEVSGVDTNFGVDIGNYPVNRQFLVGLSLAF
ncbi:MAG: TonB-dependent receptor [Chitinophagaceae bacterium]|nr:TonB-dependent receptor [Chitinophagaceae bacterium]